MHYRTGTTNLRRGEILAKRQAEAAARAVARKARTAQQQLALLDQRRGESRRERARLS